MAPRAGCSWAPSTREGLGCTGCWGQQGERAPLLLASTAELRCEECVCRVRDICQSMARDSMAWDGMALDMPDIILHRDAQKSSH